MTQPPAQLVELCKRYNQSHVFAGWELMDAGQRASLVEKIEQLDFAQLDLLYGDRNSTYTLPSADSIAPLPGVLPDAPDAEAKALGEAALARGEVAALVVAGGQGTRLGFDHPKGMFPIGPVTNKSLFHFHAEKVLARTRRHGRPIPLLVMTSHATHAETEYFFAKHANFGLAESDVHFFQQGTMPALDLATGKLLMEHPGGLFTGPDGHGGSLTALAKSGLLKRLADLGIRHIFYFQVDNPLVKICDPQFLGQHIRARAEISSKVIPKDGPHDKLGNFVLIDNRLSMIEYSDLPDELARQTDADGQLRIRAGNPAIHIFDLDFLRRVTAGKTLGLSFHIAKKKVPYWDPATGEVVEPTTENALKFERFIFDVLQWAERWVAVETSRAEEFAPLKNASGPDSAETVRQAISELATHWVRRAGAIPAPPLEISSLAALEFTDLRGRWPANTPVTGLIT